MSDASKAKLRRFQEQKEEKKARENAEPEESAPRSPVTSTTYFLPNQMRASLQKTKLNIQTATEERRKYSATNLVRTAIHRFMELGLDDQIESVDLYLKFEARVSG